MRAVHWLRSRQEERELIFWLSAVAYDPRDRSFNNRIYLVYLIVFFSIWVFFTLSLFASGGEKVLLALAGLFPGGAASALTILILMAWSLFRLRQSLRRSPVPFTEEDAQLINQMPVSRRAVVLRWFWMPWLESAVPFWLIAVALGFSFAEVTLPGEIGFDRIFEYAGFGLRAWLAVLPVHLALFALIWIAGVYRLQKDVQRRGLAWALLADGVFAALLLMSTLAVDVSPPLRWLLDAAAFPIRVGFGTDGLPVAMLIVGLLALALLAVLALISGGFSMSRAAQETQTAEALSSMQRYGFVQEAERMRMKKRLGVQREATRLPALPGAGALVWKDVLQSQRLFRVTALYDWLIVLSTAFSLALLPTLSFRALVLVFWVIQVGKLSVARVRNDLALWPLIRQLPISSSRFLLADLSLPYLLAVLLSLVGLGLGSALSGQAVGLLLVLLPGTAAAVAGMAAFDVIRRSRSGLLMANFAPEAGALGVLLGILCAAVPLAMLLFWPGAGGLFLAVVASLLLGLLAFKLAVRYYRGIE